MPKIPLSIDDQIILLQKREMQFRDVEYCSSVLANISYYRLKGYWWEFQDDIVNHHFKASTFFEGVVKIYAFDKQFRLILFNYIESIEIALRTKLIYHMSLGYGPLWYMSPSIFQDPIRFTATLGKINLEVSNSSEEFIIKHFQNHPSELPESWKSLEVLTLGTLSKLYSNLKHQLPEKNRIATEFGLNNQKYLVSWLLSITVMRNIIAHHGRLWNRVIINKYDWPPNTPEQLLNYIPDNFQRRKIFPILSAIIYMNNHVNPDNRIKKELKNLFQEFPNIPLGKMGFPDGWQEQPIWKNEKDTK